VLADFKIEIHEARKPLVVQVKIHDSVAALRAAVTKWEKRGGRKTNPDNSELLGVCHRFHMMGDPLCAIVRLAPPHVGAGMVAHEMGHAAVHLWEIQNKFNEPLHCGNDEWFCWILGELCSKTTIKLLENHIY
jgi:hypothetical protein